MKGEITLVGAGLVGALLGTLLAQRGFTVTMFERRPDPRRSGFVGGRSINLALAERGWHGLRLAGLSQTLQPLVVMMRGRMVHHQDGRTELLRYGRDDSEVIWSISRGALNMALLDAAEAAGATIHFDRRLDSVDWDTQTLTLSDEAGARAPWHFAHCVLGTDGAGSALRTAMAREIDLGERFEPLDHGYKELEIPARGGENPFAMEANALHIWPRGNYMCIALPNAEGSFTVTLFLPNQGNPSFATVLNGGDARNLFARDFPDALTRIPDLQQDFDSHPTGMLGTLYLDRWHLDSRALLLGDAAHAIVPFHGQGMNCGFEDAAELAELLGASGGRLDHSSLENILADFEQRRKPNADAIAAMALENYIEMRDRVGDADFLLMRSLERKLAERRPGRFVPRYAMVTFSRIPYAIALERGKIQAQLLLELTQGKSHLDQVDLSLADIMIDARLLPLQP